MRVKCCTSMEIYGGFEENIERKDLCFFFDWGRGWKGKWTDMRQIRYILKSFESGEVGVDLLLRDLGSNNMPQIGVESRYFAILDFH